MNLWLQLNSQKVGGFELETLYTEDLRPAHFHYTKFANTLCDLL
jgi:hypothetical protein